MSSLTVKQRAKVNAALCVIHDAGMDVSAVTSHARTMIATGHDARSAYEKALNAFAQSNPQVGDAVGKVTRLVEASCPRTVAQYDIALAQYIETGDDSALRELEPIIAQDSIALAVRNGEITTEEAATVDVAAALGFETAPSAQQAHATAAQAKTAITPSASVGLSDPPAPRDMSSQVSPIGQGGGMVAPKARHAWADAPYTGMVSATPAFHGLNPSAAREAAKERVLNGSRAILTETATGGAA